MRLFMWNLQKFNCTDYDMKRERRDMVMEGKGQPATERLRSINRNKTKSQHEKLSHQLLDKVQEWFLRSKDLFTCTWSWHSICCENQ